MGSLAKAAFLYGGSTVILQLIGFITVPLFTRVFSPQDYGIVELLSVSISLISFFVILGFDSSAQRSFYDYKEEHFFQRKLVVSTALWFILIWSIIISVSGLIFREEISELLFGSTKRTDLIALSFLTIPFAALAAFFKEIIRMKQRPLAFFIATSLITVLGAALSIAMVFHFKLGLFGIYLGGLIGSIVAFTLLAQTIRKDITNKFSLTELKTMLSYGIPLIPAGLSMWGLSLSDRYLLNWFSDLHEVGLYSIANKVTSIELLVIGGFSLAWSPFILSLYSKDKKKEKELRSRVVLYLAVSLAFIALTISIFAKEILTIFTTKSYIDAADVVWILSIGMFAFGMSSIFATGITLVRQTKYFAAYALIAVITNIALNLILIPKYGMSGAAVSTAISYILLMTLYFIKSQQLYYTEYKLHKLAKLIIAFFASIVVGILVSSGDLLIDVLIKGAVLTTFLVSIFFLKIINISEPIEFIRYLKRRYM